MGRRKIEIKAIKDDRNRSVTFLKRKGGLFKKAHELSVLCSVDVAVIIFGQNKKLYEYSSGNIHEFLGRYHYCGGPHEHKGPADFANKGGQDDDDDDDDNLGSPGPESPPHHTVMQQNFTNQPNMQHMRHAPSASPPMPNGVFQQHLTPNHAQGLSRPTSRNHNRRPSSNLVPQHLQAQAQAQAYAYQANGNYYQSIPANTPPPQLQQGTPHMAQHHYSNPMPVQTQMQYMQIQEENRRQSMPPNFTVQSHEHANNLSEPPQRPHRPFHSPPIPEHAALNFAAKPNSLFAPMDDQGNMMAQRYGMINQQEQQDPVVKLEHGPRSHSIDVGYAMRNKANGVSPQQRYTAPAQAPMGQYRSTSVTSLGGFGPPLHRDSIQSVDVKRPRLKVQIPSEKSDAGSTTEETGGSSPKKSGTSAGTGSTRAGVHEGHSAVVLPPPSPSASALLSAGATGPKNPFARPPPPNSTLNNTTLSYRDTETPLSALPSRFMSDGLLPSPSTFYPEWNFANNNLASPAIYQPTPLTTNGPSFRDDDMHMKRKSDDDPEASTSKKSRA